MAGEVREYSLLRFGVQVLSLPSFPLFCAYMLLVPLAPFWQKRTKPHDLRIVMVIYNGFCSLLNAYSTYGFVAGIYHHRDQIYSKHGSEALQPFFDLYWLTKVIELLDTVFMIVRHRSRQVSFLHVFHHSSMLILSDYARILTPWPAMASFLAINSFVHVVLYLYYGISAYRPGVHISWKRRLTEFQILQFFVDLVFGIYGYMYAGFCIYSLLYGAAMIYLFCNFYYHAYLRPKPARRVKVQEQNGSSHIHDSGDNLKNGSTVVNGGAMNNDDLGDNYHSTRVDKQKAT